MLEFNIQEIAASLGDVKDGDLVQLTLTGILLDGTLIKGVDCVLIVDNFKDDRSIHLGNDKENNHKDKGKHKSEGKKKIKHNKKQK